MYSFVNIDGFMKIWKIIIFFRHNFSISKLPWGNVSFHNKFGPNRFICSFIWKQFIIDNLCEVKLLFHWSVGVYEINIVLKPELHAFLYFGQNANNNVLQLCILCVGKSLILFWSKLQNVRSAPVKIREHSL